jgi:hypothetical protein
MIALQV